MPLTENNTIQFATTLFALVRTSLKIRMTGNMNANDTKLRKMILEDWPNILPRVLNEMIPKHSGTVEITIVPNCPCIFTLTLFHIIACISKESTVANIRLLWMETSRMRICLSGCVTFGISN